MGSDGPLHDQDALAWAEHQAALLRRVAAGEALDEAVDWDHVIEEVQDVGLSELRACRSLLRQALVRLLKLHAWPASLAAGQWRQEVYGFLDDAGDRFSPSMRQRIDLDALYAKAVRQVEMATDESGPPQALPKTCPYTLDGALLLMS
jgi:hypothetical protein